MIMAGGCLAAWTFLDELWFSETLCRLCNTLTQSEKKEEWREDTLKPRSFHSLDVGKTNLRDPVEMSRWPVVGSIGFGREDTTWPFAGMAKEEEHHTRLAWERRRKRDVFHDRCHPHWGKPFHTSCNRKDLWKTVVSRGRPLFQKLLLAFDEQNLRFATQGRLRLSWHCSNLDECWVHWAGHHVVQQFWFG